MIFKIVLDVPVIKLVTLHENSQESWHDFKTLNNHLYIIKLFFSDKNNNNKKNILLLYFKVQFALLTNH